MTKSKPRNNPALHTTALLLVAVLLAATACGDARTTAPTVEPTRLTALLFGKLVETEGCLRVNESDDGASYLLAWPPDFAVSVEDDTVRVIDARGTEIVLHVGDTVRISGGEVRSIEYLDERVRRELPAHCPGPYWVVGAEVSSFDDADELE